MVAGMGFARHVTWVCVLLAGCLEPGAYRCGDQTCPAGTVCDETNVLCLTQAQATVCYDQGIAGGKQCNADGMNVIDDDGDQQDDSEDPDCDPPPP